MSKKTGELQKRVIVFSAQFNMIFLTVTILTIISAAGALYLAHLNPQKDHQITLQTKLFEQFCFGWHAGLGAIIGLLGGKMSK